jgi:hypothetical protein
MARQSAHGKEVAVQIVTKFLEKQKKTWAWVSVSMLQQCYKLDPEVTTTLRGVFKKYYRHSRGVNHHFYIYDRVKDGGHYIYLVNTKREKQSLR